MMGKSIQIIQIPWFQSPPTIYIYNAGFFLHFTSPRDFAVHLRGDGNPEIPHGFFDGASLGKLRFSMGHAAMYRRVYI
jgi:hypothetical protein